MMNGSSSYRLTLLRAVASLVLDGYHQSTTIFCMPYVIEKWNGTSADLSPIFACLSAGQMIGMPMLGLVSDKVGRRVAVLISLCGTGISAALQGIAHSAGLMASVSFLGGVTRST